MMAFNRSIPMSPILLKLKTLKLFVQIQNYGESAPSDSSDSLIAVSTKSFCGIWSFLSGKEKCWKKMLWWCWILTDMSTAHSPNEDNFFDQLHRIRTYQYLLGFRSFPDIGRAHYVAKYAAEKHKDIVCQFWWLNSWTLRPNHNHLGYWPPFTFENKTRQIKGIS